MGQVKFRHELKHYINIADYYAIRSRLKLIAKPDQHSIKDGAYHVRSLYFDTPDNKKLLEKINGFNQREKFRLRYYNYDSSYIKLEKKCKLNGLCTKQSALINKAESELLINGEIQWLMNTGNPLLAELYAKMKYQLLQPKTIVDYMREAYIFAPGNVRITIDRNIRSGLVSKDFFNRDLPTLNTQQSGTIILEVKYDEFLPEIIQAIIQTNERRATAISKYALGRMYG